METYYLVDYENVDARGLSGIDKIKETDHVILFYAKGDTQKVPIEIMDKYKSKIDFFCVPKGNQSVDVHLMIYMGYLIGKFPDDRFVIVSKDNGYNVYVNTFKKTHNANIGKQESINGEKKASDKENASGGKSKHTAKMSEKATGKTAHGAADNGAKEQSKEALTQDMYEEMNQELMQAFADTIYEGEIAEQVVSMCVQYIGEDTALSCIHNAIIEVCSASDQKAIYKRIKPILQRYHKKDTHVPANAGQSRKQPVKQARIEKKVVPLLEKQAETKEAAATENITEATGNISETMESKSEPTENISEKAKSPVTEERPEMQLLKGMDLDDGQITETIQLLDACGNEKNPKITLYRRLIKVYGKEKGRSIYNQIKGTM